VMSTGADAGQVRGPVQLTFARSLEPIVALEHSITRVAVTTEKEAEEQGGDNRTMGRKATVPYGLYRAHGFFSAALAEKTGFNGDDLALLWEALVSMFEHDRSAARGLMATRTLVVFEHESKLGSAPAHALFDKVKVVRKVAGSGPARRYDDYAVTVDGAPLGEGDLRVVYAVQAKDGGFVLTRKGAPSSAA
jgi:CRISPR-associated protein Csd2